MCVDRFLAQPDPHHSLLELQPPGVAFVLSDLYGSIAALEGNAMAVDTAALEKTFGVTLTSVADHIKSWS